MSDLKSMPLSEIFIKLDDVEAWLRTLSLDSVATTEYGVTIDYAAATFGVDLDKSFVYHIDDGTSIYADLTRGNEHNPAVQLDPALVFLIWLEREQPDFPTVEKILTDLIPIASHEAKTLTG